MNSKKNQKVFPIIENFCLWDFLAASPWATSLAPRLMSVYANLVHMPICGKSSSSYEYLKTQFNTCPTLKLLQIVYKVFVPVHLGAFIAHLVFTPHRKRLFLTIFSFNWFEMLHDQIKSILKSPIKKKWEIFQYQPISVRPFRMIHLYERGRGFKKWLFPQTHILGSFIKSSI